MKRKVILIVLTIILITFPLSPVLYANDIFEQKDETGNIIIFPFTNTIQGETLPGAIVSFNKEKKVTPENGEFEFLNIEDGTYEIEVRKENYQTYTLKITLEGGKVFDLGYIELNEIIEGEENIEKNEEIEKEIKAEDIDVADPDYINKLRIGEEKNNGKFNLKKDIKFGSPKINAKVAYLFLDYNRYIKHSDKHNSIFESSGFLTEINYNNPVSIKDQKFQIKLDLSFISGVSGQDKYFVNDILDSTTMVSLSNKSFSGSIAYIFPFDDMGDIYLSLGRNYDLMDIDASSLEIEESPRIFTKEYRYLKGWTVGTGIEAELNNFMQTDTVFDNLKIGMDYKYIPNTVEITSTKDFANIMTEGNKNNFNIYIGFKADYEITLGYRYLSYYSKERIDGLLEYPEFKAKYHGPYLRLSLPF